MEEQIALEIFKGKWPQYNAKHSFVRIVRIVVRLKVVSLTDFRLVLHVLHDYNFNLQKNKSTHTFFNFYKYIYTYIYFQRITSIVKVIVTWNSLFTLTKWSWAKTTPLNTQTRRVVLCQAATLIERERWRFIRVNNSIHNKYLKKKHLKCLFLYFYFWIRLKVVLFNE